MAIVGNLPKALGLTTEKVWAGTASVTGTGAIATGLDAIDAGSPQVTVQDCPTTIPTYGAGVSSVTGGTVNVVVTEFEAAANAIATAAVTVGLLCTGH